MNQLKIDVYTFCAGHYTTDKLPENFFDWTKESQMKWIAEHAWQPFEYWQPEAVWDLIDSAAQVTLDFILKRKY